MGEDGTLMMNTYTSTFPIYEVSDEYVFDYRSSACLTGVLPETLRKRKSAIRSKHPVSSVVAVGPDAGFLTRNHDAEASLYLPYSRLAAINGKVLFIGIGHNLVAIRHEAQRLAGLFDVVERLRAVKYRDDEGGVSLCVFNCPPCVTRLANLVPAIHRQGILRAGRVGKAYSVLAPANELLAYMSGQLSRNPEVNLCGDMWCLWCREAERRLGLYESIKNPKIFQRSRFIRTALALVNEMRLKKHRMLSYKPKSGPINLPEMKRFKSLEQALEELLVTLRFALA